MSCLLCTIVVGGELPHRFDRAFEGFTVTAQDGRTELVGPVTDQSELQGLLRQLFDLGLEVVSFTSAPAEQVPGHDARRR